MITEEKVKKLLHSKDRIKNFKTLCEMFDLKPQRKSSASGKAILKQLSQFCDYSFDGQTIIIQNVKAKNTIAKDERQKKGKFSKYIQAMILHAVYNHKGEIYFKPIDLWRKCGMINAKYKGEDTTALSMEVQQWEMDSFYKMTKNTFNKIIMQAIQSLRNAHLIMFDVITVIVPVKGRGFVANEYDIKEIETAKRLALKHLGFRNDTEVILKNMSKEYAAYVREILKENRGWDYYFYLYKITGVRQDLVLDAINEYDTQLKLNHNIIDSLNDKVDGIIDKQQKKLEEHKSKFKYPDYFSDNQKILINKLITLDPAEIKKDVTENYELDWELFSGTTEEADS